ncbi:hypothetical protein BJ973_003001 [Actinoplanes tereljensis]|uniref:Methyltransferase n=1 Tax=Paractinoplanes tereljensis TaxID=571912 RepID=A0A919NR20_9ACTN|nr:SAM-dependent methyltransferase [Actinoplanes tereljensis]GIF22680.1 hypothetical protein Ate02nite_54100 [Actinoplanes tereljensis]
MHPARRYNYWLGGQDHGPADRASGDAIAAAFPIVAEMARANRRFLGHSVAFLAGQGVRQFLDIGTGLPAPGDIAHVVPGSKVFYVDNDPVVSARMIGRPYLEADVRDPEKILRGQTLDLTQPVGLVMLTVLHFVHDDTEAAHAVRTLLRALAPGSWMVLTHGTMDFSTPAGVAAYEKMFAAGGTDVRARTKAEISGYFAGTELVPPGLGPVDQALVTNDLNIYAGVGRKL